ncbi:DDB1- and CUL4-associated factor 13 [Aphelenchoides bicaudatus]|nr:DDB1- and CUL4-associated factor 13 [Aphelenchoides bicaudatus]
MSLGMAGINVKVISRNPDNYQRETKNDIHKARRNFNAAEDPFRHQVEYTRALNSAKLERMFAKPFICALDGHSDGVHTLAKHPSRLSTVLSGSLDGQVKIWSLSNKKCLMTIQAHTGPVNGLSVDREDGKTYATVGQDSQLKLWTLPDYITGDVSEPLHSIPLADVAQSISHFANSSDFATSGDGICSWKIYRDSPVRKYDLGPNSVHSLSCNPIEPTIVGGCSADRSIFLLDLREKVPMTRVMLKMRTNKLSWNPIESYTFLAANEDYNVYAFDMRYLDSAKMVYKGSTLAVMDVDYAPTGQEFVAGSYDRSLRLYRVDRVKSREIYHAPRMQHVMSVLWSMDNKYVLSGSDEFNIRLWKAYASEKLGPLRPREKAAFEYHERLRDTYQHHPEVGRILRHRQLPKRIYTANNELPNNPSFSASQEVQSHYTNKDWRGRQIRPSRTYHQSWLERGRER